MNSQIGSRLVFENAKSFIQSQGYDVTDNVVFQDNKSLMLLE